MSYTVKAVAEFAGVSVRTLHHYDAIGLVRPVARSDAGYRLYSRQDLERLQQVLFFRELGFGLGEIRAVLDSPEFDRLRALHEHRRLLHHRKHRLERLIAVVDRTIASMEEGTTLDEKTMFDGFDPSQYEEEARRRWGHTRAYQESRARMKSYGPAELEAIGREQSAVLQEIAALADRSPDDAQVLAAVGRMHRLINERFYTCSLEMFRGLGNLAVEDERFTRTYERLRPGLAAFYQQAVKAYCDRGESES